MSIYISKLKNKLRKYRQFLLVTKAHTLPMILWFDSCIHKESSWGWNVSTGLLRTCRSKLKRGLPMDKTITQNSIYFMHRVFVQFSTDELSNFQLFTWLSSLSLVGLSLEWFFVSYLFYYFLIISNNIVR